MIGPAQYEHVFIVNMIEISDISALSGSGIQYAPRTDFIFVLTLIMNPLSYTNHSNVQSSKTLSNNNFFCTIDFMASTLDLSV